MYIVVLAELSFEITVLLDLPRGFKSNPDEQSQGGLKQGKGLNREEE